MAPKLNEKHDGVSRQANEPLGHVINEIASSKSSNVQVGEFVFDEVDISDTIIGPITADGFYPVLSSPKNSYKVCVLLIHMTESGKCDYKFTGSWTESLVCV